MNSTEKQQFIDYMADFMKHVEEHGIFYRVKLDAEDNEGFDYGDRDTAVSMMHDLNEDRLIDDEAWRWAFIQVIDAHTGQIKSVIRESREDQPQ